MASSKRIGFFWGEEKVTLVEFEKNTPLRMLSASLSSKNAALPFSSGLAEEIQITTSLKKLLEDNNVVGTPFFISLPMKDIILRSFAIPFVKANDAPTAIKFEAKKYIPFDINELSYVFYTVPFNEGQAKKLQVVFFAARREVLAKYERIFQQLHMPLASVEPYIVSLAKALLLMKSIKPADHIAFLTLDRNLGRLCFIDKGVPQFIREFSVGSQSEDAVESPEALHSKILNEIGNSFDFYARQFNGEKLDQILVSSDFIQKDLMDTLENELKVKMTRFAPNSGVALIDQSGDMDVVYAMGSCVTPPIDPLSKFNFLGESVKVDGGLDILSALKPFQESLITLVLCGLCLFGLSFLFQMQLKLAQARFDRLSAQEGADRATDQAVIQAETKVNTDKLAQYKAIRTKSDVTQIILKVASHLPKGTAVNSFNISYANDNPSGSGVSSTPTSSQVTIDLKGHVAGDPIEQVAIVNQVYSDIKNDKELAAFVHNVNLVSFNPEMVDGKQVTGFVIHCS